MFDKLNIIVACAGRWPRLNVAAPTWCQLARSPHVFIATYDWDRSRSVLPDSGHTHVIIEGEREFSLAIALNAAFIESMALRPAEWTLIVDADVVVANKLLFNKLSLHEVDFIVGHQWIVDRKGSFPQELQHLTGTHLVRSALREKIGGADVRMRGWGGEDEDAYERYQLAGGRPSVFDSGKLLHLEHTDEDRTRFYREKDKRVSRKANVSVAKEFPDPLGAASREYMRKLHWYVVVHGPYGNPVIVKRP